MGALATISSLPMPLLAGAVVVATASEAGRKRSSDLSIDVSVDAEAISERATRDVAPTIAAKSRLLPGS